MNTDKAKLKSKKVDAMTEKNATTALVKFSDLTVDAGYKISYELTEKTLPPKYAAEVEKNLRHSAKLLKEKNRQSIEDETVALVNSSVAAVMSVAKDEKSFDEASRELVAQGKTAVKNVVIENAKEIALEESKKIGADILKKSGLNILKSGGKVNPAVNALILGDMIKDSALKYLDGKISEEQFIKEVAAKGTVLAVETVGAFVGSFAVPIPVVGAIIGSTVTSVACNAVISVMNTAESLYKASKIQMAADRRRRIEKIKSEALTEMKHQREIMQKCFADEKLQWDKNVQTGFELIAAGTYENNVDIKGLDNILKNFGSQVAFSNRQEFRADFRRRKIVVNL